MELFWSALILVWCLRCWKTQAFIFEKDGYMYKITTKRDDRRTFYEAEEICQQQENGHLVSIMGYKQNEWLNSKIRLVLQSNDVEKFWVGANDKKSRGIFQWMDGKRFVYSKAMLASARSIFKKRYENERCLYLRSSPSGAVWADVDCYESMGYICKIQGYPKRIIGRTRFGYEFDYGHYIYKIILMSYDTLPWPEAEIYCKHVETAHLLSIETPDENQLVQQTLRQVRAVYGFRRLWIGASDFYDEGNFIWSDGKPVNFSRWAANEPSGKPRGQRRDCAVATITTDDVRWYDEECLMELPFICKIKMCNVRVDVGFVIDSSGSVTGSGFLQAKRFVKAMISRFDVSPRKAHVAVIRYSTEAKLMFRLDQYFSAESLARAVDNIAYIQGGTRTHVALKIARESLFTVEGGARPMISKFMILLTDGASENSKLVAHEARKLKKTGVYVVAVGIGPSVNRRELITIASTPDDVINVRSFESLLERVTEIRARVCNGQSV
ncbi:lymphocyte antigen 75-like [Actinia tenebrosa]|uniref:Lymphocyte antigen 75-like n=1 Tax=Actinia tenebrosa TaxID=6105 RepID=A0A6P8HNG5_ACTTE|nr:lymphocyte antigen 75-like [Actinia tenebrosa]